MRSLELALVLAAATSLAACDAKSSAPAATADGPSAPGAAKLVAASAERGRKLFVAECAGCHGERGRGDGPAAVVLDPKPRDFTREKFKFRSTEYGDPPTRQDVFDTITAGLAGSAMPSFRFLPDADRRDLVEAVFAFAGLDRKPQAAPVVLGPETPNDAASLARGRKVFERLDCGKCHGDQGRGDGTSAPTLHDEFQRPAHPRDLTGVLRRADSPATIHLFARTGLAGTPMPGYAGLMSNEEGWDLTHYVVSMKTPEAPFPTDPVERGRRVVADKRCDACHVIEGKGGRVGPSLDVAAQKLRYDWAAGFLANPRAAGKIYPYIPYRMPDLGLTKAEIDGVLSLFAKIAGRAYPEPAAPAARMTGGHENDGKLLFFLRCTECHNFGTLIPTPLAKQQGPDLLRVTERIRPDWIVKWVADPKSIYPDTRMTNPSLTPAEIEAVCEFVWNTSLDALPRRP